VLAQDGVDEFNTFIARHTAIAGKRSYTGGAKRIETTPKTDRLGLAA
jgi:hypothetical protein